jgi:hypothetical protein
MKLDTQKETEQRFVAVAEESLEEFKRTGEHITFEEFSTWVQEVKTNPKAKMPNCHK